MGGKDHYAVDRAAADKVLAIAPDQLRWLPRQEATAALALRAVRGAPGGAGRVSLVEEGLAALRVGAGLETGPPAGDGGSGDGDGDGGHQVWVAGAGGAGQPDRARGIDGEDETAVGERPGQAGGGIGVLAAAGVRGQDILIDSRRRSSAACSELLRPASAGSRPAVRSQPAASSRVPSWSASGEAPGVLANTWISCSGPVTDTIRW